MHKLFTILFLTCLLYSCKKELSPEQEKKKINVHLVLGIIKQRVNFESLLEERWILTLSSDTAVIANMSVRTSWDVFVGNPPIGFYQNCVDTIVHVPSPSLTTIDTASYRIPSRFAVAQNIQILSVVCDNPHYHFTF